MSEVNVFFATGYEEVEALTVVDLLRRAGIETDMVSVTGDIYVTSSHGVTIKMDKLFEDIDTKAEMIVLPGGVPGASNLQAHKGLTELIKKYNEQGKYIAAICAAPFIYGELGLLNGKKACCYPGYEEQLKGAKVSTNSIEIDGNVITSRALGTAIEFGLTLVTILKNKETADVLANKILYRL